MGGEQIRLGLLNGSRTCSERKVPQCILYSLNKSVPERVCIDRADKTVLSTTSTIT